MDAILAWSRPASAAHCSSGYHMEIGNWWQWLKDHDAPNWFAIRFSLVLWPMVLSILAYYWSRRKVRGIPHFDVQPTQGQTAIGGQPYNAVNLTFTNLTGSIVYIRLARLREQRSNFPIPPAAVRSISGGWRELVLGKLAEARKRVRPSLRLTKMRSRSNLIVTARRAGIIAAPKSRWVASARNSNRPGYPRKRGRVRRGRSCAMAKGQVCWTQTPLTRAATPQ
jgi:hypothetical protein